jgi:hypothetical protein
MALLGKAVLGVWNDVDPAIEDDFNDWYLHEHIPERTSCPGMVRGRRYRAMEGAPRYMAFYEALTLDVLTTGVYRTQLDNPTPWTQRVMPGFRVAQRGICNVIASVGEGVGGGATVIHIHPAAGGEDALRAWTGRILPKLMELKQITAAHVWAGAAGEPISPTTELALRAAPDRPVAWVLAIEAADVEFLEAARRLALDSDLLASGAADVMPYPSYRLLFVKNQSLPHTDSVATP